MLTRLNAISGCVGCSDDGSGNYLLSFPEGDRQATVAEVHAAALAIVTQRIRAECERRQFETPVPVVVGGATYRFQADRDSRGRYAILGNTTPLLMMQGATMTTPLLDTQGTQVTWWTEPAQAGGAKVACPMTVGVYLALVQAAMGRESALDSAYRAHVQAAAASTDPLAYDYSGNWPA